MRTTLLALLLFTSILHSQCPAGNVTLNSQVEVDQFVTMYPNCERISGYLLITGDVNDLSALASLQYIEDDLIIRDTQLTTISNFNSLIEVIGRIEISRNMGLTEIFGFNELLILGFQFYIEENPSLITINGFNKATDADGEFLINRNTSLLTIVGFSALEVFQTDFEINDSPELSSIPNFNRVTCIGSSFTLNNTGLTDITGFNMLLEIQGLAPGFIISNNQNLAAISGFNSLESIGWDLLIEENPLLKTIAGLCSLTSVYHFFTIRNNASLISLNGLQNLSTVSINGNEVNITLEIINNPELSDCNPLCNLLSSNGIIGLTNIANNLSGCNSVTEVNNTNCIPQTLLNCTNLSLPLNGELNVEVNSNISWNPVPKAIGYLISVGTNSGEMDIEDNFDVGDTTTFTPSVNLPADTTIFVTISPYIVNDNSIECIEEFFSTRAEIIPTETETIFVPKFFTPNNDNINDTWIITDPVNEIEVVHIYDRYGKLLQSLSNIENGWDGLYNNKFMPSNDYWYAIKLKNGKQTTGHFSLKR
ncbi:T9SS type B sorting domain-containing protein [Maribacter sp.]|nr:T9SS type B sorting domain-containing protein [Maribacter sp.]